MQAYYVVQVEKALDRYERLVCADRRTRAIWERFDEEETEDVQRWLEHGRAIRAERAAAQAAGREPDFARLARSWGGVTIVYRKRLQDSPAYRLNHEEVINRSRKAFVFAELLSPTECVPDAGQGAGGEVPPARHSLDGKTEDTGEIVELPARAVMVAAGTHPNVIYEREYPGPSRSTRAESSFKGIRLETTDGQRASGPLPDGRDRILHLVMPRTGATSLSTETTIRFSQATW